MIVITIKDIIVLSILTLGMLGVVLYIVWIYISDWISKQVGRRKTNRKVNNENRK